MTENNNPKLNGGNCSSCLHYFEGKLDQSVKTNTMNINCDYFMEIKKKCEHRPHRAFIVIIALC